MILYTSHPHRDLATNNSVTAFTDTQGEAGTNGRPYKLTENDDGTWTVEHEEIKRDSDGVEVSLVTRATLHDVIEVRRYEKLPKRAKKS